MQCTLSISAVLNWKKSNRTAKHLQHMPTYLVQCSILQSNNVHCYNTKQRYAHKINQCSNGVQCWTGWYCARHSTCNICNIMLHLVALYKVTRATLCSAHIVNQCSTGDQPSECNSRRGTSHQPILLFRSNALMIILDIDSWLEPTRCDQLCICSDPRTNVLGSRMHMDTRVQFKAGHESSANSIVSF